MIQGIFASNQGIVGDRVGDFSSAILRINPSGNSLMLAMSSGMATEAAADTVFNWFEDGHQSGRIGATGGGTTTTVPVTDGSVYVPNQVLMVEETGEHIFVESVSGNNLTVMRGMAGTTIVSISNGMNLQSIGNAHEEGSAIPEAVTQQGAPRLNFTQIFRNSWAVTGTAKAVKFKTGNKVAKNKADCALYHAEDIERAILWSRKMVGKRNGKPFRFTDGLIAQIENYGGIVESVTDGVTAGNYSQILFNDFIRRIFSKQIKGQPNERMVICGDIVLQVLNNMALLDSHYHISEGESVLGIMVTRIQTPFGKLTLMTHPLMNENPVWQHEMYVFHPGAIRKRVLRPTFQEGYDTNGNRIDGKDADQGLLTTELGIECGAAQTMGILRNFQKAVAST